jgi:hypothetical protein
MTIITILSICEDNLSLISQYLPLRSQESLASTCKALYYTTLVSPAAEYGFRSRCLCALDQRYPKPLSEPSSRQTSHPSYETAINLYKSLHCPSWRALYYIFVNLELLLVYTDLALKVMLEEELAS